MHWVSMHHYFILRYVVDSPKRAHTGHKGKKHPKITVPVAMGYSRVPLVNSYLYTATEGVNTFHLVQARPQTHAFELFYRRFGLIRAPVGKNTPK